MKVAEFTAVPADSTVHDVLIRTREILAEESRWHRGSMFAGACQACLMGAIGVASGYYFWDVDDEASPYWTHSDYRDDLFTATCRYMRGFTGGSIPGFNDSADHSDVIRSLDEAIEASEQAEV